MIAGDVARSHRSRTFLVQAHFGDIAGVHANRDGFQVEENVDHVLLYAFDRRILVQYAFDFDFGDRGAGQRRQQYAPQRIAQRVAEAALKRFDHDSRMARRHGLYLNHPRLQKFTDRSLHGYHLR